MELHQDPHHRVQVLLLLQPHDPHAGAHLQATSGFLDGTRQVVSANVASAAIAASVAIAGLGPWVKAAWMGSGRCPFSNG